VQTFSYSPFFFVSAAQIHTHTRAHTIKRRRRHGVERKRDIHKSEEIHECHTHKHTVKRKREIPGEGEHVFLMTMIITINICIYIEPPKKY